MSEAQPEPSARAAAALARSALGRELGPAGLRALVGPAPPLELAAGDVLAAEGKPAGAAFVVGDGRVAVETGTGDARHVLETLGRGALVGELAPRGSPRWSVTLRATRPATVCRVTPGRSAPTRVKTYSVQEFRSEVLGRQNA